MSGATSLSGGGRAQVVRRGFWCSRRCASKFGSTSCCPRCGFGILSFPGRARGFREGSGHDHLVTTDLWNFDSGPVILKNSCCSGTLGMGSSSGGIGVNGSVWVSRRSRLVKHDYLNYKFLETVRTGVSHTVCSLFPAIGGTPRRTPGGDRSSARFRTFSAAFRPPEF